MEEEEQGKRREEILRPACAAASRADERISRAFIERWIGIDRLYADYAKANGLTYMSFSVLSCIYDHPEGCTQKMICEEIFYSKQSVNLIVRDFWKQGLVELRELPSDRRNKKILLTASGRSYAQDIVGRVYTAEENAAAGIPIREWREFLRTLDNYAEAFSGNMRQMIRREQA